MAISGLAPPATVTRSARCISRRGPSPARRLAGSLSAAPSRRPTDLAGRGPLPSGGGGTAAALRDQPGAQLVGVGDGGGEADGLEAGRERAQAGEAERQEVAALVGDQRVELVEDDGVEVGEEAVGVGRGEEQGRLLGRGRAGCRAASASGAGACASEVSPVRVSSRTWQADLGDRLLEVAGDIDGERLQRRDVEGVDAAAGAARWPAGAREARRGSAGSRRASCRRRSARSAASSGRRCALASSSS